MYVLHTMNHSNHFRFDNESLVVHLNLTPILEFSYSQKIFISIALPGLTVSKSRTELTSIKKVYFMLASKPHKGTRNLMEHLSSRIKIAACELFAHTYR